MILRDLRNNNLEKISKGLAAVLISREENLVDRELHSDLGDMGCRKDSPG